MTETYKVMKRYEDMGDYTITKCIDVYGVVHYDVELDETIVNSFRDLTSARKWCRMMNK